MVRTKFYWSWAGGQNKVLLVLVQRTEQSFTGLGLEDRTKFYWSWRTIERSVITKVGFDR